jgi:hypothetical protein
MYTDRHESMHNLSTEEKLLLFQQNIELRTRESLQQQVKFHFRSLKKKGKD